MHAYKLYSALSLATLALGQRMKMVQAPFNATAYHELMGCVGNASTGYHIAVHHGAVAIIPAQGEAIDLDTTDTALDGCLEQFSPYLNLAVHYSRTHIETDGAANTAYADATAEWAEANGAQGMTLQNMTQSIARDLDFEAAGSPSLLPRQVTAQYWFSLGNMKDKCKNFKSGYDQENNVLNECINHKKPYKSIVFSNPNNYNSIRTVRWPHHKCAQDPPYNGADAVALTVPARSDSPCIEYPKDIFSFKAAIVPKSCFGTCQ